MEQTRLIVIHDSPNDSEQMVNALRNAGQKVRSTYVDSAEGLSEALGSFACDLVLTRPSVEALTAKSVIEMVEETGVDLPVIVLVEGEERNQIVEYMKWGAVDVVSVDELAHLMFVLMREFANLQERRFRQLLELEVEEMQKRCQLLLGSSLEPVAYVMDGMHLYANEAYMEAFGFEDAEEVECVPLMDVIVAEEQAAFKAFLKEYMSSGTKTASFSCAGQGNKDEPFAVCLMFSSAEYDGESCTQVMIARDQAVAAPAVEPQAPEEKREELKAQIQEEVHAEIQAEMNETLKEKIAEASAKDPLTGILNRERFKGMLAEKLIGSEKSGAISSLYYIVVDRFIELKKEHGLARVDDLLKQVVGVFNSVMNEKDLLARFADSDFCILCDQGDENRAIQYAERVREAFEAALFDFGELTVTVTVSVGITFVKPNIGAAYDIISRGMKAAVSLQQEAEGNGVRIYRPPAEIEEGCDDALRSEEERVNLQKAIDNNLFRILFQPIISLRGEEFEFYEVLLRLIDQEGKEISPDQFLGQAVSANLSEKIDRWVILQSIKTVAARRAKGFDTHVLVNLTSQSIRDASLIPWLGVALKAAKLPKGVVTFQVNEKDACQYLKPLKEFVAKLHEFGCKFSVSRFGVEDAPLDLLKHADAAYVKLDGSLIRALAKGDNRDALTGLVAKIHESGRLTIAPFVENAGILSELWQFGVNYIQGYYLQPPMPDMSYDFSHGH